MSKLRKRLLLALSALLVMVVVGVGLVLVDVVDHREKHSCEVEGQVCI